MERDYFDIASGVSAGRGRRVSLLAAFLLLANVCLVSAAEPVTVGLVEDTGDHLVIDYAVGDFAEETVLIEGKEYTRIALGKESPLKTAGAPELPNICRSIIIPGDAEMAVKVLTSEYYDVTDVDVVPSKGFISRSVNPDDVPYTFGAVYQTDAFYPGEVAALREPYVLRDLRGVVVEVNPFQYNPVTRTLRVYTRVTVEVDSAGPGEVNVLQPRERALSLAFHQIYRHHFLNYAPGLRYTPLEEDGDMLIICHDAWIANVQPLVAHKNGIGLNTSIVGVSTIGNNSTAIKNYIQGIYDTSDLAFVLLVGDAAEVDTPYASGGSSDPSYALLSGGDGYPDILIGRFSAQSAADVDTQVERTIEYEQMPATQQDWFKKATGIASDQGAGIGDDGEADWQHMDNIRADLLAYGYTVVDQIYDPTASASQVTAAVNAGRGLINYCGHGSTTSWGTTGFSNTNVNALVNDNMLPFIFSVACVNGQFDGYTCFGEAWLRATHNGEPTGAIGIYASSINQSWAPPMCAQDESVDLLVAEAYASFGALCFAGSCQMIDEYGSGGESMYNTWHVFGDPSVRVAYLGPMPPVAQDQAVATPTGTPVTVTLQGGDDGLPDPPAALDYAITALPAHTLQDAGDEHIITAGELPYTLLGDQVIYKPGWGFNGPDSFQFRVDDGGVPPEGGASNTATVSITVGGPEAAYTFPMDDDPGWSTEASWAFGQPTGGGSAGGDPTSGYTGLKVYGYNLTGDYANNLPVRYLTTTALDCTGMTDVELRFQRWLKVETSWFDHANIEISNNGSDWTTVWVNGTSTIIDSSWVEQVFDISAMADGQPAVSIRWGMGPTDGSSTYPGWNIDDVEIWCVFPPMTGDCNSDKHVTTDDYGSFEGCLTGPDGGINSGCECANMDADGDVDLDDFARFQSSCNGS
ncbi:MAG TPA: C25 family cysteine peptidase [Phycisphaerae bacterium]|nr:C25 family cysteine peptidase [Phycisphaerae bacterium]